MNTLNSPALGKAQPCVTAIGGFQNVPVPPLHVTQCEQSFRNHHITYSGLSQAVNFKEQMFLIEALDIIIMS